MREPKPTLFLFVLYILGDAVLIGWWLTLTPPVRAAYLSGVLLAESVATLPPAGLGAQARWLIGHRLGGLSGMSVLGGLALVIGLVEGWERRRHNPFGGLGIARLAIGQILATVLVGAVVAYTVLPWPLSYVGASLALSGLLGVSASCVAAGLPRLH